MLRMPPMLACGFCQIRIMLDDHGFQIFEDNEFPLAYLLTFRSFGTWLHGDERGSTERSSDQRFKASAVPPNVPLREKMESEMIQVPIVFSSTQRTLIAEAITEVCSFRQYQLRAVNVRTNHDHAVVSKAIMPEKIVNDFKAYATRRLRLEHEICLGLKVWSRGASTRYLWKPRHIEAAIDYVLYSQDDVPFETGFKID